MPRNDGHIRYALVSKSRRLQKVVKLLMAAPHPLSGMEIQMQAWVTNASTSIAEIRCEMNRAEGYDISDARAWKGGLYPWHDGRPRYWLIAAPGWSPRWRVDGEGRLLPCTAGRGQKAQSAEGMEHREKEKAPPSSGVCQLQRCGRPIPAARLENGAKFCCDPHKDEFWKLIRETGKVALTAGQGKLF